MRAYGLVLGVLFSTSVVAADGLQETLSACSMIDNSVKRLVCFDSAVKKHGLGESVSLKSSDSKWLVRETVNPLDDSKTVVMLLDSTNGRSSGYRGKPISLFIRCRSNKTQLYVDWRDYLGRDVKVTERIGKGKAVTSEWGISTDKKAAFKERPIPFIKKLMKSDSLVLQVTPYNESPVTADFDTAGLSEAIKPLRETCNW